MVLCPYRASNAGRYHEMSSSIGVKIVLAFTFSRWSFGGIRGINIEAELKLVNRRGCWEFRQPAARSPIDGLTNSAAVCGISFWSKYERSNQ